MISNERLEEIRHFHKGWLSRTHVSPGQHKDSQTVIDLLAHCDAQAEAIRVMRDGLEDADRQFYRIETARWQMEQARLGAKSGGFGVRKALAECGRILGSGK